MDRRHLAYRGLGSKKEDQDLMANLKEKHQSLMARPDSGDQYLDSRQKDCRNLCRLIARDSS